MEILRKQLEVGLIELLASRSIDANFFNNINYKITKSKIIFSGNKEDRIKFVFYRGFIQRFLADNGYQLEVLWQN